jgi:hypothetical protein
MHIASLVNSEVLTRIEETMLAVFRLVSALI